MSGANGHLAAAAAVTGSIAANARSEGSAANAASPESAAYAASAANAATHGSAAHASAAADAASRANGSEAASGKQRVVFCDFDGTITENDNIVAIIRHFNPPGWDALVNDIIGQRKSVRQGVGELFRLLPASKREEVIDYAVGNARIRAGFAELLAYCRASGTEFYVTSGGIDFFVYPLLAPFDIPADRIYCNGSDFTGERIEITWPHPCDDNCANECGMCKTTIIRRFPKERYERILIGDSVTDFAGAKLADVVFARSHLIAKCRELGLPYYPYETFYDVVNVLEQEEDPTT